MYKQIHETFYIQQVGGEKLGLSVCKYVLKFIEYHNHLQMADLVKTEIQIRQKINKKMSAMMEQCLFYFLSSTYQNQSNDFLPKILITPGDTQGFSIYKRIGWSDSSYIALFWVTQTDNKQ